MANGAAMGFFEVSKGASRRARIRAELPIAHPEVLDEVSRLLDQFPDPALLSTENRVGTLAAMAVLTNRMQAYLTAVAGAAHLQGDAQVLRAGTTGTLVAAATGSTLAAGSAMVHTGAELGSFPELAEAFRSGRVSSQHVSVILETTQGMRDRTEVVAAAVALAAATDPRETRHVLQVAADAQDGDRGQLTHAEQQARRGVRLSARPSGMWRLSGLLDDVEGARLAEVLAQFTAARDAGVNSGESLPQRRADALAEIAAAAAANRTPLGTGGLSVLIDADDLPQAQGALLSDGTPITAETFELLTCTAVCALIIGTKGKATFVPIMLGRTRRRASAAQWAALIARDRGCVRCGRSPRFCEAHHVVHWRHGGLTDTSNMVLLCSRCHRDLHHGRFTITMTDDGIPELHVNRGPPARVGG